MAEPMSDEEIRERRKHLRAKISLNGVLVGEDGREIEISSVNISESGMLIAAREPVEEFTVVSAVLRLPGPDNGEEEVEVYCESVVVRIEYDSGSEFPYRLAVHFSRLDPEVRAAIRDLIKRTKVEGSRPH